MSCLSLLYFFFSLSFIRLQRVKQNMPHQDYNLTYQQELRFKKFFFFFPVALQSSKDLGRLTYRRFLELFRHMVRLLGRVISPSQTQHRKTRTNIHALSGIRTHDPSNQPAKTHASDRTATVTGKNFFDRIKY
jgi:hypothetical protein